jgi:membrane protease YdiL (CAAX protease family)
VNVRAETRRAALSLFVFLGWILITALLARLWEPVHVAQGLASSVAKQISPSIAAAIIFLFVAIAVFHWNDIGLNRPRPLRSLTLLWFPALYVAFFVVLIFLHGIPPVGNSLIILANTAMVGVSEEVACRGILYQGLRSRFSPWGAILGSTALFGVVHMFNGFTTGDFLAAAIQAVTAFMTGIAFMGIRIRTDSLLPGIALHGAWDFAAVMSSVGSVLPEGPPESINTHSGWLVIPILAILPNFLYGLFLLRHAGRYADSEAIARQSRRPAPRPRTP